MITLMVGKTTGKQAYKIVCDAIAKRKNSVGQRVTQKDFCDVSGLSRNSLWRYQKGDSPDHEGIIKIYTGLLAWGFNAEVKV